VRLPRLYAVVDVDVAAAHGWTVLDLARACLEGGARCLQLRAKDRPTRWILETADALVALASGYSATVIVNDRADVARLSGASGVHVGQDDLSPLDARVVVGPDGCIGLSTHTRAQVDAALDARIDYVAVGPVYGTVTKDTGYTPVGLDLVQYAASCAATVAVISDLLAGGDPASRVRAFGERLKSAGAAL
jgi:thiamine-phosphate pyrophosphorylase